MATASSGPGPGSGSRSSSASASGFGCSLCNEPDKKEMNPTQKGINPRKAVQTLLLQIRVSGFEDVDYVMLQEEPGERGREGGRERTYPASSERKEKKTKVRSLVSPLPSQISSFSLRLATRQLTSSPSTRASRTPPNLSRVPKIHRHSPTSRGPPYPSTPTDADPYPSVAGSRSRVRNCSCRLVRPSGLIDGC